VYKREVLEAIDLPMPEIDIASIGSAAIAPRRTVTPPASGGQVAAAAAPATSAD